MMICNSCGREMLTGDVNSKGLCTYCLYQNTHRQGGLILHLSCENVTLRSELKLLKKENERLRIECELGRRAVIGGGNIAKRAGGVISDLRDTIDDVTQERDEAVAQLKSMWCKTCVGCECEPPLGENVAECKSWLMRGGKRRK